MAGVCHRRGRRRVGAAVWLDDSVPTVDPSRWRLTVVDGRGQYDLDLSHLSSFDERLRSTLDCTSGWYAQQDWAGAPVSAVLRDIGDASGGSRPFRLPEALSVRSLSPRANGVRH